jgi:hypothetical protein
MTDPSLNGLNDGDGGVDDSGRTMSLMGGVVRPEGLPEADGVDLTGEAGGSRLLNTGTLLILLIVGIVAVSLYAMRATGSDLTANPALRQWEAKIEQTLAKLSQPGAMAADDPLRPENLDALFTDADSVLTKFQTDFSQWQVPVDFVKKDPFQLAGPPRTPEVQTGPNVDRARAARRNHLQKLADRIELQGVMPGATPVAIIKGELRKVGDTVGEFTIRKIRGTTVTLEAEGFLFFRNMEVKQKQ